MPVVSQDIEELEGSVERAQVVLDQVRARDRRAGVEQNCIGVGPATTYGLTCTMS